MRGRSGLGLCAAIVMLWGVAAVVRAPRGASAEAPPSPAAAVRVAIRPAPSPTPPEPPAEPQEAPEPQELPEPREAPEPASAAAVATARTPDPRPPDSSPPEVGSRERTRGESLLSSRGAFPPLHASYAGLGSWDAYASAMRELGARFVVVERRRIVGELDATGELRASRAPAGSFSPRARDYSDEPALATLRARVRARWGPGASVMMLVPRRLDAALFGTVARWLEARDESPADYRVLEARYARGAGGGLQLNLEGGTRLDGTRRRFDLVFDLSRLVAAEGDA